MALLSPAHANNANNASQALDVTRPQREGGWKRRTVRKSEEPPAGTSSRTWPTFSPVLRQQEPSPADELCRVGISAQSFRVTEPLEEEGNCRKTIIILHIVIMKNNVLLEPF